MKRGRLLSLLMVIALIIGLLPLNALAVSNTGTGISVTTNPNHFIRRVNHHGSEYTYKPPLIDGKWGYCVDFGYSYNSEDANFRSSYSWTHATGAEAEDLLDRALIISGMADFSPEVVENAKWLMSYINQHYTLADNELGAWLMTVQTYLWDNMERKAYGDTADAGSNVDDGGYADVSRYERYKELYTWLLTLKAEEDVDLQNQVAELTAQGIDAYIAVDPASQWAVYATSSISGRQGFFNYNETRIIISGERPEDPDIPPSGEGGVLTITKRDSKTNAPLAGATYRIEGIDQAYDNSVTTGRDGMASVEELFSGSYKIYEISPPEGYLLSNEVQTVHYDGERSINVTFCNDPMAVIELQKQDAQTGAPVSAVFDVFKDTEHIDTIRVDGSYTLSGLSEGTYTFVEVSCPGNYILNPTPHSIHVDPGSSHTVTYDLIITNQKKPGLEIWKYDQTTKQPLPDVTFAVYRDTELYGQFTTNAEGCIYLDNLLPGTYLVQEIAADDAHVVNSTPQQVEIRAGDTVKTLVFFNSLKPGIHLTKVDSITMKALPNVRFEFKKVGGSYRQEFVTDINGEIDLSKLDPGAYEVRELEAPEGYLIDNAVRVVQINPDGNANFVFTNTPKPSLRIVKTSSDGSKLSGVHFRIAKIEDGSHYLDRITDSNGEINIIHLEPGVYSVKETATVADHILDLREYHVELFPGQTSTLTVENQKRPNLIVYKHDADTGDPVPDTVFIVRAADGHSVDEIRTDKDGKATLANLLPGVYEISEKSVPAPWLMDANPQLVTLYANRDHTVYFENHKKPTLTVNKVDSITGSPIKGAKFEVWYGSNSTTTGELNNLGTFFSDENGQFFLDLLRDGWYKVTELEPAPGFTIKEPATQEFYVSGGESKVITFTNVPKNAIAVEKYDSVTGEALPGCTFQLRYLGGTSGTGGTVIGEKVTGKNGTAIWTGLNPGAYVLEEVDAADGYSIIQSSETIMLADNGEQSVVTIRFTNAPDGILLIRKVCAVNPSVTLQNAEFKVAYADGTLIGDSNGIFITDENGEIRITGLKPGKSVVVTETKAPAGYLIDTQSQTVQIKEGRTVSLTFKDQPKGAIIIQKRDSATGLPLSGAEFRVTTAAGCEVGLDGVIGTSTLTQNGIVRPDRVLCKAV
jgi:uncharacterized surface anchored protein